MTRSLALLLPCLAIGCFSPEVNTDEDSSTDGPGSSGTTTAGTDAPTPSGSTDAPETGSSTDTATETATDSVGETDATGNGVDGPPVFESFTVNGSTTPAVVSQSSLLRLEAEVSDDVAVGSVEFYEGDDLLGTATVAPYELEFLVTSTENGDKIYRAVATDSAGQTSESSAVETSVSITGGDILDINTGLGDGCVYVVYSGGLALLGQDRMVVAAVQCDPDTRNTRLIAVDGDLDIVSTTTLQDALPIRPSSFSDDRALIPTLADFTPNGNNGVTANWHYNVFDPQLGDVIPAAGLLYSGLDDGSPFSLSLPGTGVVVARSATEIAMLEPDLDSSIWVEDASLGSGSATVLSAASSPDLDIFVGVESDGCPKGDACITKYRPDGTRAWTRPTIRQPEQYGLASDGSGGIYYALRRPEGYLVGHLDTDGEEVASEMFAFDAPPSGWVRIAPDSHGGVIMSLAVGEQDPDNPGYTTDDEAIVMRLNASLDSEWEVSGFGPGESRVTAIENNGAGGLFVVGVRATPGAPSVVGVEGELWIARVSL